MYILNIHLPSVHSISVSTFSTKKSDVTIISLETVPNGVSIPCLAVDIPLLVGRLVA